MPQPDLDTMIADVLAKHAAATSTPWNQQRRSASYIDILGPGERTKDCSSTELAFVPVCRVHVHAKGSENSVYLTTAANAAPVLARRLKLALEALTKVQSAYRKANTEEKLGEAVTDLIDEINAALAPEVPDDQR